MARFQLRRANTISEHEIPIEGEPLWDDLGRRLGFWNSAEQLINWFRIPLSSEPPNYVPESRWVGNELSFRLPDGTWGPSVDLTGPAADSRVFIPVSVARDTDAVTLGNAKTTFRTPYPIALSSIKASLTTAQASGSLLTLDVKYYNGETWLSVFDVTLLSFNNGSRTTVNAVTPAVLGPNEFPADTEMRVDVTQVGNGTAAGLKLNLLGNQT